ncbi:hypothetical protein CDD83_6402 [Cordyceps sp. RAO-2017]|nr:hypothetical protein CDD83_6402 [Cordyceps sp. RAO-2017]
MLSVDNVAPSQSRLKFYVRTPHTSFSSVRAIMTMGGKIDVAESQLSDLRSLIVAAAGLEPDFPDDAEVPLAPEPNSGFKTTLAEMPVPLSGYEYYFDIAPGAVVPHIKFYLPLRHYGPDDLTMARGLTSWMETRGRGQYMYGQRYLAMLERMSDHRKLGDGKGMHAYLSCIFAKGELDITSCIAPELCVPAASTPPKIVIPRRATRRRGDSPIGMD